MWEIVLNTAKSILGGTDKDGQSQFLELFKGQQQKQREFELEMNRQFKEIYGMELKDVASAREMQIAALNQNDRFSKRFIYYLASVLLLAAVAVSILPFFYIIPEGSEALVNRATDFLYMVSGGTIIGFFFGKTNAYNGSKR